MIVRLLTFPLLLLALSIFFSTPTNAQMMGSYNNPSITVSPKDIQQQQLDEAQGKQLLTQLQSNQLTCQKLSSTDFEKIGEYAMSQKFNNTNTHIQMNNNIKGMMGNNGEENMHIKIGQQASNCYPNMKGGGYHMMGWGNGGNMMYGNGFGAFGIIFSLFWLVGFIDLVLLGLWLYKQLKKK
jgi:hypothetical protein